MDEKETLMLHSEAAKRGSSWTSRASALWRVLSSIVTSCAFLWLLISYLHPSVDLIGHHSNDASLIANHYIQAPYPNLWKDLSSEELAGIVKYLHSEPNLLNLTGDTDSSIHANKIALIELLQPNKTEHVLPYLNGSTVKQPPRFARVTVSNGPLPWSTLREFMVGPLPAGPDTRIEEFTYAYNAGRNTVQSPMTGVEGLMEWLKDRAAENLDMLLALMGDSLLPGGEPNVDDLAVWPGLPQHEGDRTIMWATFLRNGTISEAHTLLAQGMYVKIDVTATEASGWAIMKWMYDGIVYDSTEDLRGALKNGEVKKIPLNLDGNWTNIDYFGRGTRGRELPAPAMVQASTPRYELDRKEKFVSWMGFEFFLSFSQVTGITLWDIKFRGERIIYELGMQEALAHYAGDDPMQAPKAFLDTFFSMGKLMFELVPGYDCPAYADYLDTHFSSEEKTEVRKSNICLFEYTADHALQRHTSSSYVSISRNTYFVVRTVSVVGNYDYTFDYIFYLDGTIEVKVRASGYIEGTYWSTNSSREYGYRAHDQFATSIHDHVLNFKADLDIGGTANTLVRVGVDAASIDYEWDWVHPRNTMKLTRTIEETETGLNWPANSGAMYVVVNEDLENSWGEKRGYRIMPGTGVGTPAHLTVLNSSILGTAAEWATKDFWLVQHKDTEPRSSHPQNWLEMQDPMIDFGKFVNGESTVQEDLVVYFNLGSHHLPDASDLPNTLMHTSASSIMFMPHNFFDRDPSRESSQGVRLALGDRGKTKYYGGRYEHDLHVKLSDVEPDLKGYHATEHAVRKMPWEDHVGFGKKETVGAIHEPLELTV